MKPRKKNTCVNTEKNNPAHPDFKSGCYYLPDFLNPEEQKIRKSRKSGRAENPESGTQTI